MQGTSIATSGIFYNTAGLGFIDGIFLTVACTPYNWETLVQGCVSVLAFSSNLSKFGVTFPPKK